MTNVKILGRSFANAMFRLVMRRQSDRQITGTLAPGAAPVGQPFIAYSGRSSGMQIKAAWVNRGWMDDTYAGFANRCLPLRIANQGGWFILNDRRIEIMWTGGSDRTDLNIHYCRISPDEDTSKRTLYAESHFGHGILTWQIPYLFRTPPGYNLYVRGPTNWLKDGICPLDGIVESDWTCATFTMNWKLTRPRLPVFFERGEPICMIFPVLRGAWSSFSPTIMPLKDAPTTRQRHKEWSISRRQFNESLESPEAKALWQKHYYIGKSVTGEAFPDHEIGLNLREFEDTRNGSHNESCDS